MDDILNVDATDNQLINWIYSNSKGDRILSVGCERSYDLLQFAREAKELLCIDDNEDNIARANKYLVNENDTTKEAATFTYGNIFSHEFNDQIFDSIIFDSSLNSVTEPERYLRIATSLLKDNGQILITLPFGLNRNNDKIKPYYLSDLQKLAVESLTITDVSFINDSIGIILRKKGEEISGADLCREIKNLEEAFYRKEISRQKGIVEQNSANSNKVIPGNKKDKDEIKRLENKYKQMNSKAWEFKKSKNVNQKKLLEAYKKEKEVLIEHKKLLNKYNALSQSKLGKLTLAYWRWSAKRRKK